MLHQYILKKGIDPKDPDQTRLGLVLQGTCPNHPIVLKLSLKGARTVPTYHELMRDVCKEETLLEEKSQGMGELSASGERKRLLVLSILKLVSRMKTVKQNQSKRELSVQTTGSQLANWGH